MKKRLVSVLLCGVITFPALSGQVSIPACDARSGNATVVLAGVKGKWVGFSARAGSGEIIDLPPEKVKGFASFGSGSKIFHFGGNKGVTSVRASTWADFDKKKNLMEDRKDDSGWVSC
ncbi:hypothetical protein BK026_01855 [Alteromonas sp. V450]|uniref:hypothetical protein n=1 Tax=Alteromonas sp. V450 TaxID=1912139 RepID=UPI0008FF696B|nr:hypothetical protein [Alteromonas sp. V450]OJF67630.1 hypothetical protein BK026_01855 [Alteromonas sp. V450]